MESEQQEPQKVDWDELRKMKLSNAVPPEDWLEKVVPISIKGLSLRRPQGYRRCVLGRPAHRDYDQTLKARPLSGRASGLCNGMLRYAWGE
jgi:hypothetical protein